MLHEEKFVLHQRKLSDFSERQQGDYMTLRNILYINTLQKHSFYVAITMILHRESLADLYYKKFPIKRRYFSLWQSKQLKHPNMRAISPSLGSCFISSLFMQKQFRYFWLSFNPFSNSSIVGIDDLKSFGKSLGS